MQAKSSKITEKGYIYVIITSLMGDMIHKYLEIDG